MNLFLFFPKVILERSRYHALAVGVDDIWFLNKSSRTLVQPPKEKKAQGSFQKKKSLKNPSRKSPEEQWSQNTRTCKQHQALMQGWQVSFSALFPQGTKLWVQGGSSFLSHHMQFETQALYSIGIPAWVSPGAGTQSRETFYELWMSPVWVLLNYSWAAHQWLFPWAGFPKVWDFLLEVKTISPAPGRQIHSPQHILSDWELLN